jgi:uncharacterized membrane protein YoaK (UPF0700 family)
VSAPAPAPVDGLRWQRRPVLLIGLTAAAGWLDALAWLYLGKVFLSFMSGNLLFLGIGAGTGNGGQVAHAGVALGTFLLATAAGGALAGSRLRADETSRSLVRTLSIEVVLLAAFAVVWVAGGNPLDHAGLTYALLAIGAAAMGLQAAVAVALHVPNVATVAMTATLAQSAALLGWRAREGRAAADAGTPALWLMVTLCAVYLLAAFVVAVIPEHGILAAGPVLLLIAGLTVDARTRTALSGSRSGRPAGRDPAPRPGSASSPAASRPGP